MDVSSLSDSAQGKEVQTWVVVVVVVVVVVPGSRTSGGRSR